MKFIFLLLNYPLSSLASVFLRVTLAGIIFPHGAQKVLGLWGGYGFDSTLGMMTHTMGIPWGLAILAILTEFLSPFFLLLGLGTRLAAVALAILMLVITKINAPNGFFMNWFGHQKGEGMEFSLLFLGTALALLFLGPGKWSLDAFFAHTPKEDDKHVSEEEV